MADETLQESSEADAPEAPQEPLAAPVQDTRSPLVSEGLHPDHAPPRVTGVGPEPYTTAEHIHHRETGEQVPNVHDTFLGGPLRVVNGEHKGQQVVFLKVHRYGADGTPDRIISGSRTPSTRMRSRASITRTWSLTMAESQDDRDVDRLIGDMRNALDALEAAQRKDVKDESKDDDYDYDEDGSQQEQPKTLKEARVRVREHFRRARRSQAS